MGVNGRRGAYLRGEGIDDLRCQRLGELEHKHDEQLEDWEGSALGLCMLGMQQRTLLVDLRSSHDDGKGERKEAGCLLLTPVVSISTVRRSKFPFHLRVT